MRLFMLPPTTAVVALFLWSLLVPLTTETSAGVPKGHGEPLGNHRDSDGHVDILTTLPSPQEFWDKYVSKRRPVLFSGAARSSPGMQLWTDEYMLEKFGDLKVRIEGKHQKEGKYPEGEKGIAQDTLRNVLQTYRTRDVYVVSQIPDPLTEQVAVLPFLTCGTFKDHILESNLWLGGHGTQSQIHKDADNAINCLFSGTKTWIMISQDYEHLLPVVSSGGYSARATIDPDDVDLIKYPKFSEVPYTHVDMKPGDCLFIPASHWHQVNSHGSKNLAVSIMMSRLKEVDLSECDGIDLDFKPLSEMNMVFTYDGYSEQTMGDMDPFELRERIVELCSAIKELSFSAVYHEFFHKEDEDNEVINNAIDTEMAKGKSSKQQDLHQNKQIFAILDTDGDNFLSCDEEVLPKLSIETLKNLANIISYDPSNSEEYEFSRMGTEVIRILIEHVINKLSNDKAPKMTKEQFLLRYRAVGGSRPVGSQLYDMMDPSQQGYITREMVLSKMEDVISLYDNGLHPHHTQNMPWQADIEIPGSLINEVGTKQQWKAQKIRDDL
ncbi:uncharacterized protein [Amphiura filiformis]|uniref:uncharacterized protein n=1 Tax=Amphiura filiformis TaxID=82378 RepID=UPI003B217343